MTFTDKYIDMGGTVYYFDRVNNLPNTKENALIHHIVMDCHSWTFNRMTQSEKESCINSLLWAAEQNIISGSYRARWNICQAIYFSFLSGLGYNGPEWRAEVA